MFDRFTDRARKALGFSRQEAQRLDHDYIGAEHILLGLIDEGSGVAADALKNLGVDPERIRQEIEKLVSHGTRMVTMGQLPFTPRAKRALEFALEEAHSLGHNYIGTEHLLLGLIREQEGIAAQVLENLGVRVEDAREQVRGLLGAEVHGQGLEEEAERPGRPMGDSLKALRGVVEAEIPGEVARLTRQAREAILLARAGVLGRQEIGTELLLLGAVELAASKSFGLSKLVLDGLRRRIESALPRGTEPVGDEILSFSPGARKALELAFQEAADGSEWIGIGHLVVGLIREGGAAARILSHAGIELRDVLRMFFGRPSGSPPDPRPPSWRPAGASVMGLATLEAHRFRHNSIDTGHVLLGLLVAAGGAADLLEWLGVDLELARAEIAKRMLPGDAPRNSGHLPFTPAVKRVLELTLEEANALGHKRLEDEHLLLGLLREGDGVAAQVLAELGVTADAVRRALAEGPPGPSQ
jgi:ATP-dependent Clp protease ATP-binding subunit ClpA